jgi:hypothetical protein
MSMVFVTAFVNVSSLAAVILIGLGTGYPYRVTPNSLSLSSFIFVIPAVRSSNVSLSLCSALIFRTSLFCIAILGRCFTSGGFSE